MWNSRHELRHRLDHDGLSAFGTLRPGETAPYHYGDSEVGRSLQTSRRTVAECSDRKVKIDSRSLTERVEELITKVSDYILKLTIEFLQKFTKKQNLFEGLLGFILEVTALQERYDVLDHCFVFHDKGVGDVGHFEGGKAFDFGAFDGNFAVVLTGDQGE